MGLRHEAPDEVWISCWLQQLQPEVGEDRGFQQLHQPIYLYQHLNSHGQIGICCDDITGVAVGPCQKAQAEHRSGTVAPAAVQAVEEVGSGLRLCCLGQQAAQCLCLLASGARLLTILLNRTSVLCIAYRALLSSRFQLQFGSMCTIQCYDIFTGHAVTQLVTGLLQEAMKG